MMRGQIDSKSDTSTEDMFADAASISLRAIAHAGEGLTTACADKMTLL